MSSIKILKSFRIPTNTQSFLLPSAQSGVPYLRKEVEVRGPGSPLVPAPSLVSLPQSPVNPKPCGTSRPTSKSPFTPFLPAASLLHSSKLLRESSALLLHLAFQLPKLHGKGRPKAAWFYSAIDTWCFLSWLPCLGLNPSANLPLQSHI